MKTLLALLLSCVWFALTSASTVHAQAGPESGGHELQLWTGGGFGTNGITKGTHVWTAGARYGWVLTGSHGPGFLRGRFEYTVDVVPGFWVFQPSGTASGVAAVPFGFKWDLNRRGRIVPYFDLDGGGLITGRQVPPVTSRFNFISGGALGMHILGKRYNCSAEVRFRHISNAGLASVNPGINTLELRLGVGKFTRGSSH